ncbi:MAG: pantetheine-phosphate adenylyltransferase [Chitinophagaceae bacterium]|nr:pantetheine-phosphate adenylyltransferase [Chitinophagaceae bacterium]MCB9047090.1 pantetheine-phosphate adenylyltransferase [Chitinophagales bacterium]
MERICLFPGTFDPMTLGHVDVIKRSVSLFDKLIIAIGVNSQKTPMFTVEQRTAWIEEIFKDYPQISVTNYTGLTIDFCKQVGAQYMMRGIRYIADFEYEKAIADMNRTLAPEVETIFLTCAPEYSTVSSTIVRDVIRNGGDVSKFIPAEIKW